MSSAKVSVVTPTYNCANYIKDAIDSVVNQKYTNWEMIIIDDGSTDETQNAVKKYLEDRRIKYIWQENAGQANARNQGIKISDGEYIAFLDADDMWVENKLERQLQVMNRGGKHICYTDANIINSEDNSEIPYYRNTKFEKPHRGKILKYLIYFNFITFSSVLVRSDCFDKIGKFDETIRMGDDWNMLLRLATCYEFDYIDDKLIVYRKGRPNQLSKNYKSRFQEQERIIQKFFQVYPNILESCYVKKTYGYRCKLRGRYTAKISLLESLKWFKQAIKCSPADLENYLGIIRALAIKLGLKK